MVVENGGYTERYRAASTVLVGGVNSPVRAFKSVGGEPIFMASGSGSHIVSDDGKAYVDYVLSWGPLILGHAHPKVVDAIKQAVERGTSYGAPTQAEVALATCIQDFVPSMEKIRFTNSGSEATMAALRLARGFTGRERILKFEGCYHGASDGLLVSAGSGGLTFGHPDSAGVPSETAKLTLVSVFNDVTALSQIFEAHGPDLAAVILEPVCGNMGVILPSDAFLSALQSLCKAHGTLLIFDEVMTGFRVALGGAQSLFDVVPDLTCLGKVVGGGLPCAAFGGRAEIMDYLAPLGPVYQAGTLSGNPLAMAAGLATLEVLKSETHFERAKRYADQLTAAFSAIIESEGVPVQMNHKGTMFSLFFSDKPVTCLNDVHQSRKEVFNRFFWGMIEAGIYIPPSAYEAWFVSSAHTQDDFEKTVAAFEAVLPTIGL